MLGRSPRLIFQVVGQSRDDALTVVQAGGHHPGSQRGCLRVKTYHEPVSVELNFGLAATL
jgi:hypothetical protein